MRHKRNWASLRLTTTRMRTPFRRPVGRLLLWSNVLLLLWITASRPAATVRAESENHELGAVRTPDRQMQVPVRNWQALRNANVVMQQKDYSCGAATLATIVRYFWGDNVSEDDFLKV